MAYPTDLDNFTPKVDNVDDVYAVDVNELQTAIESLETKVGITGVGFNPASASASANVVLHEDTDNGTNKITITAPSAIASDKILTLPDATDTLVGKATADILTNKHIPLNAPRGFLLNGKITVTDSGSGLVVAIKTLAGTDPSATDPVYCRIGDTVRTITSALSRTLADGTNWFNAGSAELAAKEIDYFVYLIWDSNSSAVGLGFARIPYGNLVSDFSNITTNEKHLAGYADFTTTDEVENIGRFAATLSAGAGYTWSVPTFTASNLIQRPIYETRLLLYVPQLTGFSSISNQLGKYLLRGETVEFYQIVCNGTSNATGFTISLPFIPSSSTTYRVPVRIENASSPSATTGMWLVIGGTNPNSVYRDFTGASWTASGTKTASEISFIMKI